MTPRIAVIGLGYVGLPVALAFAKKYPNVVGFDINAEKIAALKQGIDFTGDIEEDELRKTTLKITNAIKDLKSCNFFVVGVPTPVDNNNNPDLTALVKASQIVGAVLQKGSVVVYESTVYPGVTEEICGPVLAEFSGLTMGVDFKLGYSPERINPGDKQHALSKVIKVVSGQDEETLELVAEVYGSIIDAGVYKAPSIKVAEAAKVIENTQRDLNIALMNELSLIFERMNIPTREVLRAAKTKWNFLGFHPGLVGGHCIGVDPFYLTTKAEQLGYHPQVILAGRRINDSMGQFVAQKLIKLLVTSGLSLTGVRVGILGLTFKEDVPDIRNSRIPDIISELRAFGIEPLVHDPIASHRDSDHEYGIKITSLDEFREMDGLILAVPHQHYKDLPTSSWAERIKPGRVFIDVKCMLEPADLPKNIVYWSL